MADEWEFCGRYGDEHTTVTIDRLPEDLPPMLQLAIHKYYDGATELLGENLCSLGMLGLVREVGNSWHHRLVWAPQVHTWLGKENTNAALAAELALRYHPEGHC